MAELNEEIQTFIVQSLACYMRPSLVVEEVKANFDVQVSRQQVQFYNPERGGAEKRLSEQWRNLFYETRKRYDADVASIPITKLSYRLTRLQRMSEKAEETGAFVMASDLLKQAAQDQGGMYTNTRKIKVEDPAKTLADLLGVHRSELPEDLVH